MPKEDRHTQYSVFQKQRSVIISLKEEVFLQENNCSVSTCAMFFQKGMQLFINKAGSFQR